MAKSPEKPAAAKPAKAKATGVNTGKPVGPATKKVRKAVGVEKLDAGEQEIYRADEKKIDLALHHCLSHFGGLQPSQVRVVSKLLNGYYQEYGIKTSFRGMKFG
jgi:hypothetical protein